MIISDEQAERVLAYVRSGHPYADESGRGDRHPVSPELEERIRTSMDLVPDMRKDRMAQARANLEGGVLSSRDVAAKVIARSLSDSIR